MIRYPYVHAEVAADEAELLSLTLWELGAAGIEERDAATLHKTEAVGLLTLVASFADEATATAAVEALEPRFRARITYVEGDAWRDAWKEYFKPTRIGERLVVKPSWESYAAGDGDVVLTLDPGGAFGTGTHETTRLVLAAMQDYVAPGQHVLDVGCGSGILAIACLLLGAERARCIDNDPEAVRVTQENALHNGVATRLSAGIEPLSTIDERYPLVVANIESRVLLPMVDELCARVAPGGVLILSGILAFERERMLQAYTALVSVSIREQGEWIALVLKKVADAG